MAAKGSAASSTATAAVPRWVGSDGLEDFRARPWCGGDDGERPGREFFGLRAQAQLAVGMERTEPQYIFLCPEQGAEVYLGGEFEASSQDLKGDPLLQLGLF